MTMSNDDIYTPPRSRAGQPFSRSEQPFRGRAAGRGPVIDQEGREIPDANLRTQFEQMRFDFGHSAANPFGDLTREQRLARLEAIAKLLDVAFIVPGTNFRYGIDGLIGLIPAARMLGNVAVDGVVGLVPVAGDAFDVMFRANVRNVRMLKRWLDRQPREQKRPRSDLRGRVV